MSIRTNRSKKMKEIVQSYNKKTKRWIKGYRITKNSGAKYVQFTDVKQRLPQKPFKGVKEI